MPDIEITKPHRITLKEKLMTHPVGTREQWLKARLELLQAEKELTRRSDELALRRQALPWVRVEQDYSFDAEPGKLSLGGPVPRPNAITRV